MTIANFFEHLPMLTITFLVKLCIALIILLAVKMLTSAVTPIIHDMCKKNNLDHHTCYIINKTIRYLITMLGATIALQNLGIDMSMLMTAFGITGIVLSYGMKDIVANFIASILIMGYKLIKLDDKITVRNLTGTVIDINLRYTTLKTADTVIYVPNIVIYTEPIVKLIQE